MGKGRRTVLTDSLIDEACKLLKMGNYVITVCDYLSICKETWYSWVRDAEAAEVKIKLGQEVSDSDRQKIHFLNSTKKAKSEAIVRNLSIIQQAAPKSWQAAAWYLERTNQAMFGQHQTVTVEQRTEKLTAIEIKDKIDEIKRLQENNNTDSDEDDDDEC